MSVPDKGQSSPLPSSFKGGGAFSLPISKPGPGGLLVPWAIVVMAAAFFGILAAGCGSLGGTGTGKPTIVVTYSILGSLVRELVGDKADVQVPMPNGQDPHEWEPSARDIQTFNRARLSVANGL